MYTASVCFRRRCVAISETKRKEEPSLDLLLLPSPATAKASACNFWNLQAILFLYKLNCSYQRRAKRSMVLMDEPSCAL